MNWVEWIFAIVALIFLGFLIVLPVYVVVHNILDRRRDREALRRRVHDAIEKITADGKVEGPKGPYLCRPGAAESRHCRGGRAGPECGSQGLS